jgi:hypothetical protein
VLRAGRLPEALSALALALAVVAAVGLFPVTWEDSGTFALWALGGPVLVAALPLLPTPGRTSVVVTWLAGLALLVWAFLLALGIGLFLLPAALVELAAAAVRTGYRGRA